MRGREAVSRVLRTIVAAVLIGTAAPSAVAASCSVSVVTLAFGNYDPFRVTHTDSVGNITVACDGIPGEAIAYTLVLNAGTGGSYATRRMRSASGASLNYNIYTSSTRSTVWGDGSGGSIVVADAVKLLTRRVTRNYPVYGRVFGRQNAPVGVYLDSIVVTLNF